MDFAEKVRWRCTHPDPGVDYGTLADKYRVKAVVRPHFSVAECYKVARSAREIDQAGLPSTFVMKGTHRWNRAMLAVNDRFQGQNRSHNMCGKSVTNTRLRWLARKWLMEFSREWLTELHYRFVEPGILFEELIDPVDHELQFFLFYGICHMTMVVKRGFNHQNGIRYRLYDGNWRNLKPGSKKVSRTMTTPLPGSYALRRRCSGYCSRYASTSITCVLIFSPAVESCISTNSHLPTTQADRAC